MIDIQSKFSGFQEKRMHIFGELVRRYWNGQLNNVDNLKGLARDIKDKYSFSDEDLPFIKDHIRVAMGLNPKGHADFREELDVVRASRAISLPIVAKIEGPCEYCGEQNCEAVEACKYEAHIYDRKEGPVIVNDKCLSCGQCVTSCEFGALADKIEFVPLIDLLKDEDTTVYAAVAPAVVGQFGDNVTMGQLRTGLKLLGFQDMIEVALFADILTIREAFEFNQLVKKKEDFFLTSCCCPVWFNLTEKHYPDLFKFMSPSVSPMVASGRILKKLYDDARVVFIAPCIAKKAETKVQNLKGAIDFVINFRELKEIFDALNINLEGLPADEKDQASFAGRVYARTGGVSLSVKSVVNRLEPTRLIKLRAKRVDGINKCKAMLDDLSANKDIDANFIEGMGCGGGCVGGPRTNIDVNEATKRVNEFGEDSLIMTPFDNLNAMKILKQLGIDSLEQIMEHSETIEMLIRK